MLQKLHCNVFMLSYRGYGIGLIWQFVRDILGSCTCPVFPPFRSLYLHVPMSVFYDRYGASDGYPSQHGIIKDAQVCTYPHFNVLYLSIESYAGFQGYFSSSRLLWTIWCKGLILIHLELLFLEDLLVGQLEQSLQETILTRFFFFHLMLLVRCFVHCVLS